jgi:hypothetical protein
VQSSLNHSLWPGLPDDHEDNIGLIEGKSMGFEADNC